MAQILINKEMPCSIEADFEAISTDEEQGPSTPTISEPQEDSNPQDQTEVKQEERPRVFILSSFDDVPNLFKRPELNNLGCSYNRSYQSQIWFECKTCFPYPDEGVCLGCAKECLAKDHDIDVTEFRYGLFFCDQGHQKAGCPEIEDEEDEEDEEEEVQQPQDEEEEVQPSIRHGQVCSLV